MADPSSTLLRAVLDSGVPGGVSSYTTVVIVHGFMWQGTNFKKLLPLASQHCVRIIAVNRRDYPGSSPYTPGERARLERLAAASPSTAGARTEADEFMRNRAQELYDYLVDLVKSEDLPPSQGEGKNAQGGIVLVGWSLGSIWATAFLAHAPSFHASIALGNWIRRVVLYDAASVHLGQESPAVTYYPLHDQSLSPVDRVQAFHQWVTEYYKHGEPIQADTLALRDGLEEPGSTLRRISTEELAESVYGDPGRSPNGSDTLIAKLCLAHGTFARLKDASFYLSPKEVHGPTDDWSSVEVRHVWCDQSLWVTVWAARMVAQELKEAETSAKATRKISSVRLRGANHFAHWDLPEKTLRSFLGDEEEL